MLPSLLAALVLLSPPARAESFKAWAARASREIREKDDKAALMSYSSALSTWKPSDGKAARARVQCARAALRDRMGDEAGALEDYTDCLATDKKNAKAFHRRGQLRMKQGKTSLAIDDFYKAVAVDIRFGAAYFDRAMAYEKKGDREFAGEDYRHACGLGVKAACPKARELAPARKPKGKGERPRTKAAAPPVEEAAPSQAAAATAEAPGTPVETERPAPSSYAPKFKDCLASLDACVQGGQSFGSCVGKAPACEQKAVRGCCPGACVQSFRKALNRGLSEAAAYREHFNPSASCAAPPRTDDEDE